MKKIFLILSLSLFCFGCAREQNNITINIYEKEDEIKEEISENEKQTSTSNSQDNSSIATGDSKDNLFSESKSTESSCEDTKNELKEISNNIIEEDLQNTKKIIGNVKEWINENKEELVNTSNQVYYDDMDTIKKLYNKIKNNE